MSEYIKKEDIDTLVDELARAISDERCFMSRGRSTASIMQDILDLPTYSFPDSAKTDMAKPESDLISRTQAINDYAQCFADEYGMDCGEMFIGVLHQCPTFPSSADIEKIRAEIEEQAYLGINDEYSQGLFEALRIIDKHIGGKDK